MQSPYTPTRTAATAQTIQTASQASARHDERDRQPCGAPQARPVGKAMKAFRQASAIVAVLGGACLIGAPAYAHVTLETQEANIGSSYKAVFRVPHGCKGSATIRLSVQLPAGVIGVKPQPKPGWQIDIVRGKYDQSYAFHGSTVSDGVKVITWSGGRLPDDYYDEFVLNGYLTPSLKAGTKLYFPTVQTCERGVDRWIEIPAAGKPSGDYESPAPGLKLLPPKAAHD